MSPERVLHYTTAQDHSGSEGCWGWIQLSQASFATEARSRRASASEIRTPDAERGGSSVGEQGCASGFSRAESSSISSHVER